MRYLIASLVLAVLVSCKTIEIVQYQYKSTTMLGSRVISISQDSVITEFNGRMETTRTARATTPEEWLQLKQSVKAVKLEEISNLESPTNRRATDAAPFGSVKIVTKDSTYQSASFDGFDAPAPLAPLVDVIKEMSQAK